MANLKKRRGCDGLSVALHPGLRRLPIVLLFIRVLISTGMKMRLT
jgi:hypothetical protein